MTLGRFRTLFIKASKAEVKPTHVPPVRTPEEQAGIDKWQKDISGALIRNLNRNTKDKPE